MAFKMNGWSAFTHNGSPQKGIPTPYDPDDPSTFDLEHNTWHANADHVRDGGDPDQRYIWNESKRKWQLSYQPMDNPARKKKE